MFHLMLGGGLPSARQTRTKASPRRYGPVIGKLGIKVIKRNHHCIYSHRCCPSLLFHRHSALWVLLHVPPPIMENPQLAQTKVVKFTNNFSKPLLDENKTWRFTVVVTVGEFLRQKFQIKHFQVQFRLHIFQQMPNTHVRPFLNLKSTLQE